MGKRTLGHLCAVILTVLVLGIPSAKAAYDGAETVAQGKFTAEIADGAAVITAWTGGNDWSEREDAVIPQTIDGYPVKKIGANVFKDKYFRSVTLPEGLEEIGESAFEGSWLDAIRLPASLKTVGRYAFYNIPRLSGTVRIPAQVSFIGEYAFAYAQSVSAFEVDPANTFYCSEDGVLFNKAQTILYNYPLARTDSAYVVPSSVRLLYCTSFARAGYLRNLYVYAPDVQAMGYTFYGARFTVWCGENTRLYSQLESGSLHAESVSLRKLPYCSVSEDGTEVTLAGLFTEGTCFLALYSHQNRLLAVQTVSGAESRTYLFPKNDFAAEIRLFSLDSEFRPAGACETVWHRELVWPEAG